MRDHTPMGAISRRNLLFGAAGLAGAGLLAGCSGPAAAGRTISYWHLLSGGDGITMEDLIAGANSRLAPDRVVPTVLGWGSPYYTKLAMASVGGRAPDVAISHASRIPGLAPGGLLDPWDLDLLAEVGVTEADFAERIWEQGSFDGQVYSIALDAHPFILLVNRDIAAEAGVDLDGLDDQDAFVAAAQAMAEVTGRHGLSYGYLGDGTQIWRLWYTLYLQQGGTIELPEGGRMQWDLDRGVAAFRFMQRLLDGEIATASADIDTAIAEFVNGQSGMLFTGVWELPTALGAGFDVGAMPIPTLFDTPAAYADSHAFVLPHQDEPDMQARRRVYEFVADVLTNSLAWASAGHLPAFQPVVDSEGYSELEPQRDYAVIADIVNYDPSSWFTGSGSEFLTAFGEHLQRVLLAGQDPADALRGFEQRVNIMLSRPSPSL